MSFKILGPALGSFLFTAGGFVLPFEVVGSIGMKIRSILLKSMLNLYILLHQNITKLESITNFLYFNHNIQGLAVAIAMIFIIPNVQVKPETKETGTALTFTGLLKV